MNFQGSFADVMMIIAEDRDPAPISKAAVEKASAMFHIEEDQRNWSWLLNPQRSATPPSLGEELPSNSEEETDQMDEGASEAPIVVGDVSPSPITSYVEEGTEDDDVDDDVTPIGLRL
jgi:hypothetical protein